MNARRIALLIPSIGFVIIIAFALIGGRSETPQTTLSMTITSPAFKNGEFIPANYTCDGRDINPPFFLSDYPAGTESFALIVDDPDAPAGTFVHWVLYNIPVIPQQKDLRDETIATAIPEGKVPAGAEEGMTSFNKPGYGGPCPPSGTHRYFFKLYALDTTFNFVVPPIAAALEQAMQGHILDQAQLMGRYARIKI